MSVTNGVISILTSGVFALMLLLSPWLLYRVNGVQLLEPEDEGAEYFAPDPFTINRYLLEGLSLGQHDHADLFQ